MLLHIPWWSECAQECQQSPQREPKNVSHSPDPHDGHSQWSIGCQTPHIQGISSDQSTAVENDGRITSQPRNRRDKILFYDKIQEKRWHTSKLKVAVEPKTEAAKLSHTRIERPEDSRPPKYKKSLRLATVAAAEKHPKARAVPPKADTSMLQYCILQHSWDAAYHSTVKEIPNAWTQKPKPKLPRTQIKKIKKRAKNILFILRWTRKTMNMFVFCLAC